MKRIAIVNDSPVLASLIQAVVKTEPGYDVVGIFRTGLEALENVGRIRPDLLLMDIHMPVMDGVEATKRILDLHPRTRILFTTATINRNMRHIFDGLKVGALDFVRSPSLSQAPGTVLTQAELRKAGASLLRKMQTAITIQPSCVTKSTEASEPTPLRTTPSTQVSSQIGIRSVLGIGCSTGGPTTLVRLLNAVPGSLATPILVCQHIEKGFDQEFARWLARETGFRSEVAQDNTRPQSGCIYVAPAARNMVVTTQGRLRIETPCSGQLYTPNIDRLFISMAAFGRSLACCVVLTGMGNDGAAGAKRIKENGGTVFVQDQESAIVDSMPTAAMLSVRDTRPAPPEQLGALIGKWANGNGK